MNERAGMVNIGPKQMPASACIAGDANRDFGITVNEIITGVNTALTGCLSSPTPTPTSFVCKRDQIQGTEYAGAALHGHERVGAVVDCAIESYRG